MKDQGYYQAVDRLAWEILRLSELSQRPMLDANPHLLENVELAMNVCQSAMAPEEIKEWDQLNAIFETIVLTYQVDPDEVYMEVFAKMYEFDVQVHGSPLH